MTTLLVTLSALVLVTVVTSRGISDVSNCQYTTPEGKEFDFSSLKSRTGSYNWTVTTFATGGHSIETTSSLDQHSAVYYIQLQVCDNVQDPMSSACEAEGPSPVYMISKDKKTCQALGRLDAAIFEENPFKDGAYLAMFHGTMVSHVATLQSRLYFACDNSTVMNPPIFEHVVAANNQAHLKILTKLAC